MKPHKAPVGPIPGRLLALLAAVLFLAACGGSGDGGSAGGCVWDSSNWNHCNWQ